MSAPRSGPVPDREPRDLAADRREPRTYVTVISVPHFGDGGVQRLHAPMKDPDRSRRQSPTVFALDKRAWPAGPEVVSDLEASL